MVTQMVKHRQVELKHGMALILCDQFKELLICLFRKSLLYGFEQLKEEFILPLDDRIKKLLAKISYSFHKWKSGDFKGILKNLTTDDIYKNKYLLPLCMQQLQNDLIRSKRIRHNLRIRYTLFLKDCGLSLNENINFWQKTYSHPCSSHSSCQHTWEGTDASRYIYSIRHMYGLEGRKINYSSHSCSTLQVRI